MDPGKLLEKIIAQNEIIIRLNEQLLVLLAARANQRDAELLAELKQLNDRIQPRREYAESRKFQTIFPEARSRAAE